MSNRSYKKITKEEFEECLKQAPVEFNEVNHDWTGELVYEATSKQDTFTLRVFSSLDKRTGKARDKGSDAIRVVLIHNETQRPVMGRKRTNRIQTYCKNLIEKIESIVGNRDHLTFCDKCGGVMVIRKNKSSGNKFYGCTSYPNCKNTKPVDK